MLKKQERIIDILKELLSRDGAYIDNVEIKKYIVDKTLEKIGASHQNINEHDKIYLFDDDKRLCSVYEFADLLWDKMVQDIISVLRTQAYVEIYNELLDSRIEKLKEMILEADEDKI